MLKSRRIEELDTSDIGIVLAEAIAKHFKMNRVNHKQVLLMTTLRVMVFIVCAQLRFTNVMAQTFYVAPDGVDQTNTGMQARPWATSSLKFFAYYP